MKKERIFVCDFETTVYEGQQRTDVWASALVEMNTEDVIILGSIDDTFTFLKSLKSSLTLYYHNLKFDGTFWLNYLLNELHFEQAYDKLNDEGTSVEWRKNKDMLNNTFKYSISSMGQWYTITIKTGGYIIEIRDSLKLLPFSVKEIGKAFNTKHRKLEMEYEGVRYPNCYISPEEKEYIKNDVLVVKEALEIVFEQGHNKLTIGACCLSEFKHTMDEQDYKNFFPNVYDIEIDAEEHGCSNVGKWIKKSYRGGWCYLVKGKENKIFTKGTTADVNSLYPSMMSSESGNYYPVGKPKFWTGNFIPDEALYEHRYFFVRVKTRFKIKKGYLPFVQIKSSLLYKATECLETSDVFYKGKYWKFLKDGNGDVIPTTVEMTMTMTDYYLFLEHYDVEDFEILDGCWFYAEIGIFDEYINKYKKIKMESKGAIRTLAKLFLNNLYGKLASGTDSSFKVAYTKDEGQLGFIPVVEDNKKPVYIPCGSAITSYARNFTIRAAQKNYHGKNERGFIYADTDSIHCDLSPNEITGIKVDNNDFCCWKLESCWDEAIFVRQKTYIEHVTHEDLEEIEQPYYNVKCAGMPERCKHLFVRSMEGFNPDELSEEELKKYKKNEIIFMQVKREMTDFKRGLIVPSKLMPRQIAGGTLLVDTTYEMR